MRIGIQGAGTHAVDGTEFFVQRPQDSGRRKKSSVDETLCQVH